jgi:glycosyltransferase involved in cell wall biosynthesis
MSLSVSIVIPTYNRAHLIGRALSSAVSQLLSGDEVIVVDDGSTDNTPETIKSFGPAVRLISVDRVGAGRARNAGAALAKNDLVAFLDSDDEWMPNKLTLQRAFMEAYPEVLFCFSNFGITGRDGKTHRNFLINWHNDARSWDDILGPGTAFSTIGPLPNGIEDFKTHRGSLYAVEMAANYVFTSTLVVRKDQAGDALHFGEELPTYEDWECFGRLAQRGQAAYLEIETAWQHSHPGPRLTDASMEISAWTRLQVLERVWGTDMEFLAKHGGWYRHVCEEQHLIRVKAFLAQGMGAKARAELKQVSNVPALIRLLASLPSPLAKTAVGLKRLLTAGR